MQRRVIDMEGYELFHSFRPICRYFLETVYNGAVVTLGR